MVNDQYGDLSEISLKQRIAAPKTIVQYEQETNNKHEAIVKPYQFLVIPKVIWEGETVCIIKKLAALLNERLNKSKCIKAEFKMLKSLFWCL